MTATEATAAGRDLFTDWEDETDVDISDYRDLTDKHAVCNCHCGRLLLARRHLGERVPAYAVSEADTLPPVVFRNKFVSRHRKAVPECAECFKASHRSKRGLYACE